MNKWDWDLIVAVASLVMAIGSLVVACVSLCYMKKINDATSKFTKKQAKKQNSMSGRQLRETKKSNKTSNKILKELMKQNKDPKSQRTQEIEDKLEKEENAKK